MTNYRRLLADGGYPGEPIDFYREVHQLFLNHCPRFKTDEQLMRNPTDALAFCNLFRTAMNLPSLPDDAILGALENHRKIGRRRMAKI